METSAQLEAALVAQLAARGLRRAPGPLAFVHRGNVVRVSIRESLYRGLFVTVHDKPYGMQQFRAHDGAYDWDAIAACIVELVDRRLPAQHVESPPAAVTTGPLTIQSSPASPGQVRVKLSELDLDPLSAMQLYALLQQAARQQAVRR